MKVLIVVIWLAVGLVHSLELEQIRQRMQGQQVAMVKIPFIRLDYRMESSPEIDLNQSKKAPPKKKYGDKIGAYAGALIGAWVGYKWANSYGCSSSGLGCMGGFVVVPLYFTIPIVIGGVVGDWVGDWIDSK